MDKDVIIFEDKRESLVVWFFCILISAFQKWLMFLFTELVNCFYYDQQQQLNNAVYRTYHVHQNSVSANILSN